MAEAAPELLDGPRRIRRRVSYAVCIAVCVRRTMAEPNTIRPFCSGINWVVFGVGVGVCSQGC